VPICNRAGAAAIISSLVIGCVSLSYSDRLFQNARLRGPADLINDPLQYLALFLYLNE
jgi:hypothetical protein